VSSLGFFVAPVGTNGKRDLRQSTNSGKCLRPLHPSQEIPPPIRISLPQPVQINEGPRRSVSLCFRYQLVSSGAAPSVWVPTDAQDGTEAARGAQVEHAAQAGAGSPDAMAETYAPAAARTLEPVPDAPGARAATGIQDALPERRAMAALDAIGTQGAMPEPDETEAARTLQPVLGATRAPAGFQEQDVTEAETLSLDATPGGQLERHWVAFPADCTRRAERLHWLRLPQEQRGARVAAAARRPRSADGHCWP
jgi:hypothetical protein